MPGPPGTTLNIVGTRAGYDNPTIANIDPGDPVAVNGHAFTGDGSEREADFRKVSLNGLRSSLETEARRPGAGFNRAIEQAATTGRPVRVKISHIAGDGSPMFAGDAPIAQQEAVGRFSTDIDGTVRVKDGRWRLNGDVTGVKNHQAYKFDRHRGPIGTVANSVGWVGHRIGGGKDYDLSFFGSQGIEASGQR